MTYKSSFIHTATFFLIGISISIAGIAATIKVTNEIQNKIFEFIFISTITTPIALLGLFVAISTIRFQITLLPDSIVIKEGISTTKIMRDDISNYCINDKNTNLELILKSNSKAYNFPLAINLNLAFKEWFSSIRKLPEFKESKPFNVDSYPRSYKPSRAQTFLSLVIYVIGLGPFIQLFIKHSELLHPHSSKFLFIIAALVFFSTLCFNSIIETIGYKITLFPDAINVSNIFGTKELLRNDISTYQFRAGGKGVSSKVWLIPKDTKRNKILKISMTFEADQEFNDWINSLPSPRFNTPLPKIRDH